MENLHPTSAVTVVTTTLTDVTSFNGFGATAKAERGDEAVAHVR
jgi:hypothetical protein